MTKRQSQIPKSKIQNKFIWILCFVICHLNLTSFAQDVTLPTAVPEERLATEVLWQGVRRLPRGERPNVIVVMGGGGARGLSHIGVLRVLEEENIPIDQIVGVSVGALIGSLYAAGLSVDQIEAMAKEVGWDKLTNFSKTTLVKLIMSEVLLSNQKMEAYLKQYIGDKQFSDLRIPFACVATDLRTGEPVVFREGPVAIAARASATIPAFFRPVEYRQRSLVDGGLVNNLPIDVAEVRPGDVVVGVLPTGEFATSDFTTVFQALIRSIEIQKDAIIEQKKNEADILIEPNANSISLLDLGRYEECIENGTIAARRRALDIKKLLIRRVLAKERHTRMVTVP